MWAMIVLALLVAVLVFSITNAASTYGDVNDASASSSLARSSSSSRMVCIPVVIVVEKKASSETILDSSRTDEEEGHVMGRVLRLKKKRTTRKHSRYTYSGNQDKYARQYSSSKRASGVTGESGVSSLRKTSLTSGSHSYDNPSTTTIEKGVNADSSVSTTSDKSYTTNERSTENINMKETETESVPNEESEEKKPIVSDVASAPEKEEEEEKEQSVTEKREIATEAVEKEDEEKEEASEKEDATVKEDEKEDATVEKEDEKGGEEDEKEEKEAVKEEEEEKDSEKEEEKDDKEEKEEATVEKEDEKEDEKEEATVEKEDEKEKDEAIVRDEKEEEKEDKEEEKDEATVKDEKEDEKEEATVKDEKEDEKEEASVKEEKEDEKEEATEEKDNEKESEKEEKEDEKESEKDDEKEEATVEKEDEKASSEEAEVEKKEDEEEEKTNSGKKYPAEERNYADEKEEEKKEASVKEDEKEDEEEEKEEVKDNEKEEKDDETEEKDEEKEDEDDEDDKEDDTSNKKNADDSDREADREGNNDGEDDTVLSPPPSLSFSVTSTGPFSVTLFVQVNMSSYVWCTAKEAKEAVPSLMEILGFSQHFFETSGNWEIIGLQKDTQYKAYCYAENEQGVGMTGQIAQLAQEFTTEDVVTSISDIRREKNSIFFTFHTNANMRSLCRLMTSNGVSVRTILFNAERKQYGQFSNVSPKKEYRLQCDIGNDVSSNGGVFVASSTPVVIPRDRQNTLWSMVELVLVVTIVIVGLVGLLILFNYPEFFDVFFTPRDEPEKQSLLKKGRKGKKGLLSEWVCNNCHASNPNTTSVCAECRQPRGADSRYAHYGSDDETVEIDMGYDERPREHHSTKKRHHSHGVKQRVRGDRHKEVKRAVVPEPRPVPAARPEMNTDRSVPAEVNMSGNSDIGDWTSSN